MENKKNILIFTSSYPFGTGEQFFEDELERLKNDYIVTISPYYYGGSKKNRNEDRSIIVRKPMLEKPKFIKILKSYKYLIYYFVEILKIVFSKAKNKKWQLKEIAMAVYGLGNLNIGNYDIYYFYWGTGASYYIPIIKNIKRKVNIICKFHGSDLYEEVHNGPIPMRKNILGSNIKLITISSYGKEYLKKKYNASAICIRLGTKNNLGLGKPSADNIFRIVSCSNIIDIKRVDLIAEIVCQLKFKLEWNHFGEGPKKELVKNIIDKHNGNKYCFLNGNVNRDYLYKFYYEKPNDLFINLSTSEGIPVSIMEAQSFGIPAIALNVGGLAEIVHPELLICENDINQIYNKIYEFYKRWATDRSYLRKEVRKIWQEKYNIERNYLKLKNILDQNLF